MCREQVLLERACAALAMLVRVEFGDRYSLSYIADTWGEGITPEQLAALRQLEDESFETSLKLFNDSAKGAQIEASENGD